MPRLNTASQTGLSTQAAFEAAQGRVHKRVGAKAWIAKFTGCETDADVRVHGMAPPGWKF